MRTGPSGKQFDDEWREIPDSTPRSVSVDLRPKSMEQMVAQYVAQAMALDARMKGEESVQDSEDLEVDDEGEVEILTPYELHAMAADVEREARRKAWLLEQVRGKKKEVKKDGAADVPAPSAGAAAAPVASSGVEVPPPTPAPPSGGSGGGEVKK